MLLDQCLPVVPASGSRGHHSNLASSSKGGRTPCHPTCQGIPVALQLSGGRCWTGRHWLHQRVVRHSDSTLGKAAAEGASSSQSKLPPSCGPTVPWSLGRSGPSREGWGPAAITSIHGVFRISWWGFELWSWHPASSASPLGLCLLAPSPLSPHIGEDLWHAAGAQGGLEGGASAWS